MIETRLPGSRDGIPDRQAWLLRPAAPVSQLALFLDGEFYIQRMDVESLLLEAWRSGRLPPLLCLFVSHRDSAARHHELTCSSPFADCLARNVIGGILLGDPEMARHRHIVAGPSLGGLAAAHIALVYPELFSGCVAQSGSFWWQNEFLSAQIEPSGADPTRFWVSVGDQETVAGVSHPPSGLRQDVTQIDGCRRFADRLTQAGYPVHFRTYHGGHEFGPWREELVDALAWACGTS